MQNVDLWPAAAQRCRKRSRCRTFSLKQERSSAIRYCHGSASSRTAAAANPVQLNITQSSSSCSISTVLCFDSLLTECDEAGHEVSTTSRPHLQQTQGRRSRAQHQPNRASATALPYPSQVQPKARSSARRHNGPPHLHCKPCQVRRSWSPPSPIST